MIADDHAVVRAALADFLGRSADLEVIGQAVDGEQAVELAGSLEPDVILMDVSMPRLNGIEATRKISDLYPDVKIIGLSMHSADTMAGTMLQAGAVSYVPKAAPPEDLVKAIRAARGEG